MVGDQCDDPSDQQCAKLKSWIQKNFDWMNSQIEANQNDPYWHHVINQKLFLESQFLPDSCQIVSLLNAGLACFGSIIWHHYWLHKK